MTFDAAAFDAQRQSLRDQVRHHKKAIATHREQLQHAASALSELEAHARRLGLGLYLQQGVGDIHGPRSRSGS